MTLGNMTYKFGSVFMTTISMMLFIMNSALAQSSGEVQNETIIIEKNKQLDLPIANREFEKISDPQPQSAPTNSKYTVQEIGIVLPQFDTKVKVPTTKTDDPVEIHNGYIKAGFGNYASSYLEGFIHTGKQNNYSAGAKFKHLSAANGPYKGVKNSFNGLDLEGKYWTKNNWLSASATTGRERYTWYGYKNADNLDYDNDSLKNIFNKFNASISVGNMSKSKTKYTTKFYYGYQGSNHDNNESNVGGFVDLKHQKDSTHAILGDVLINNSTYTNTSAFSRSLIGVSAK